MSNRQSLSVNSVSASVLVDKHNPRVLKRTITECSLPDEDWKGFDTIRVICRFRPCNSSERAYSKRTNISDKPPKYDTEQTVQLARVYNRKQTGSKTKPFKATLDSIIKPKCTQKQVFYLVGQPVILSCLEGFNSTIFAYGQSGSGKTYTMFGPEGDANNVDQFGLIPRCFIYLFQKLNKALSNNGGNLQEFKVSMQLVQIYKRDLLDLLNPNSKVKLVIKTDFRNDTIFVQNLRSVDVNSVEEAFACLTEAQSNRIVAGHALNAVSSRSHMLVMVNVMQRSIDGSVKRSKLNFGDLAGSEDLTKALGKNPDPERRKEAIAINSSLSALTTAIYNISKGKKPGYRDSPLTHILKDSLGGNSRTVMFVACSPHIYNRNETIRALRFAQTAKKVKNKAKKNEEQSAESMRKRIKELEMKVVSLQAQLVEARGKQHVMSKVMSRMSVGVGGAAAKSISYHFSHAAQQSLSKKPGPIPGAHGIFPAKSPKVKGIHQPHMPNIPSVSLSMDGMVKVTHNVNENEEWSGSDDELSDQDIDDERVDELLKEEGGEEELNYIHEIGDLRRQLEKSLSNNNMLNTEIQTKNIELEYCNNKIAQLMEEADNAHKEVVTAKRKLSDRVATVLPVPGFEDVNNGSDNMHSEYDSEMSDDIKDPKIMDMNLPDIPNERPKIIDDIMHMDMDMDANVNGPYSLQSMTSHKNMNRHAHKKSDSQFSFQETGNNTMLQYLMELQDTVKNAKKEMVDLKTSIQHSHDEHLKLQTMRDSFMNQQMAQGIEFSEREDTTDTEPSDDTVEIEKREKALDVALKRNLNNKKPRSCFSCFTSGGDSDSDNELNNDTSLLVAEYLRNHVKAEMKKQSSKSKKKKKHKMMKQKYKKRRQDVHSKNSTTQLNADGSYNFDTDQLSILTDSPTQSVDASELISLPENTGSVRILNIPENSEEDHSEYIQQLNQTKSDKKSYRFHVDKVSDSGRNIVNENNKNNTNKKVKTKPKKTAY